MKGRTERNKTKHKDWDPWSLGSEPEVREHLKRSGTQRCCGTLGKKKVWGKTKTEFRQYWAAVHFGRNLQYPRTDTGNFAGHTLDRKSSRSQYPKNVITEHRTDACCFHSEP